ncbi:MAG: hypothetical protein AB202_02315 [Parcubacteria bacterium C7867-007]|nr:MAG: hypothetical protein AB202_02315 [Parcubacteria bacterium C7867-007]
MFDLKILLVIIASILAVIGNASYLKDAITGKVKPHPYTWFIWSIVSMTTFFGGLSKGSGIGAIPTGIAEVFTIIIFLLSLKYFFKDRTLHIRPIDNYFLAAALLGLIPWVLTKDPTISVVIVVAIDIVAFLPTLRKTWMHPETEKPLLYGMNVGRHVLTLLSLGSYNIATTIHSIAMIITNTLMVLFIQKKGHRSKL